MRAKNWRGLAVVGPMVAWAGPAHAQGFTGAYDPANWTVTPIAGGTSEVDLTQSSARQLVLVYDVDLGGGGVTQRTALFEAVADVDADVDFDWTYDYQHAWFQAFAELTFYSYDASGVRTDVVAFDSSTSGAGSTFGSVVALPLTAGQPFGVEVGGSNFDSNSFLRGTVTLSSFEGVADCHGVVGGAAVEDMCGTCDEDPNNDCVQDCNGVWGGPAEADRCGECDDDPNNDCVEDCAGFWGGSSVEDMCGVCDYDPSNDCEQDCAGEWGGSAAVDSCDVCSGGNTGIPVDECLYDDSDPALKGSACGCDTGRGPVGGVLPGLLLLLGWRRRADRG